MAADVQVGASIQVDTGNAGPSVKQVRDQIKGLKEELDGATAGSKEHTAILGKMKSANEQLNPSIKEQGSTFSTLKDHLGATVPAFKGASEGASSFGSMLKGLLMNPIVLIIAAIVAGLKFLYDAFTATDEGGQKVQAVFDGIGAVLRELMQRAAAFANAIVKIMHGDFKGAMDEGKKAVTGFGDAMVDSFKRGKEASDLLDDIADATRVLDLQYTAMNAKLAKSKELLTDENASYKDKKKALLESGQDIEGYYKKKADLDDKEITAIAKKYNVEAKVNELRKKGFVEGAKDFDDFLQTLAIGEKGINEIEGSIKKAIQSGQEFSAKQRQQNKADTMLDRQENQKANAEAKEARDKEKEEIQRSNALKKQLKENYQAFTEKLNKLQQENELSLIEDADKKKLKELQFSLENEKAIVNRDFEGKKITRAQRGQLFAELEKANQQKINAVFVAQEKETLKSLEATLAKSKSLIQAGDLSPQQMKERAALLRQYTMTETERKLQDLQLEYDARLSLIGENEEAATNLKKEFAEKSAQISQLESETKIKHLQDYANAGNAVATLIGQQTGIGKGIAAAAATIDTYAAISGQLKAFSGLPIPGYAIAQAVATGIFGLANVKKILSVQVPGGGGGGGATPSISAPIVPAAPLQPTATQSTTLLPQDQLNQTGNAAIRAYVVTTDVNNDQQKIISMNRSARLS